MATTTYWILIALGAALAFGSALTLRKTSNRRSLTPWILGAIGLGIITGATYRRTAPEIFEPTRARLIAEEAGPYAVPTSPDLALILRRETFQEVLRLGNGGSMAAADLAQTFNPALIKIGLKAFAEKERLGIMSLAVGESESFAVLDSPLAKVFGFKSGEVRGTGQIKSVTRDTFDFLRNLFLNALRMMIIPVILTSIMSGVLSLGQGGGIGRIGLKTVSYYILTSVLSITTGLLLVNLFEPGIGANIPLSERPTGFESTAAQSPTDFLFNFVLGIIPTNPVAAMTTGNVLQVISFTLLLGLFITRLPKEPRELLTNVFEGLFQAVMGMVRFLLWLAPLGVFAIFVKVIAETGPQVFADLGLYALVVVLGLLIHAVISLPAVMVLVGRLNPWRHAQAMMPALLTAFSTSSSSATLPLTMRCLEQRAGVSNRVTSFVLPLGTTVNMDGTALYECVAAVFIAQIYITQGVMEPLTAGQQVLVVITSLAASIGAAGVPMAGMVMIGIILNALGLPIEGIGYILAVDRLLDMGRTAINVWSNAVGAAVIAKSEGETQILATWPPPGLGEETLKPSTSS